MKTKLLILILTLFIANSYSQEQCGTMKNLEEQIKKDPALKERMQQIEKQNQEWIEKNGRGFKKHPNEDLNKSSNNFNKSVLNTNSLCGYDNILHATINAPTTLNQIVSPTNNCVNGGKFVRVNNLIAGNIYRISTIGINTFDTVLSIFPQGGGNQVAYNDDAYSTITIQSEVYFNPFVSGNYDILIDQYGCETNQLCASLQVQLSYIPRSVITIPVVFHVFHEGTAVGVGKNISNEQIQSQIDVLNEDFRRLNANASVSPVPFRGTSDDPLIQFCLAQRKPDGGPTNGILRYGDAALSSLNINQIQALKPLTIWNRDNYLNIWTVEIGGEDAGVIGYAQLPGDTANTDGVVLQYNTVGRVGNLTPNYNLGTNATHEVGHWLNLLHTWGDDFDNNSPGTISCEGTDGVFDTPNQGRDSNFLYSTSITCPIFPVYDVCNITYPGIMYMNYMDYGTDQCKSMFTYGQTIRMDAVLFNQRASLETSPGCIPGSNKVVISQVYGGGGNSGAPYTNDYIELFNRGTVAQNLYGWSLQVASATGTSWFPVALPNFTLQPGQYYLIQGINGANGVALPTADLSSTVSLSATASKVILVNSTTPETTANPTGSQIIDKVGYGTTPNGYEGLGPTGTALTNTTAAFRKLNGCTDSDNNTNDFTVGTPSPRNSSSTVNLCNSLSVSQNTLETVTLYPNPTNSKVFFDNSNSNFKEVSIYNYLGQEVSKTSFTTSIQNQEIDMSNLATGVYVLKLSNSETTQSIKIVKE
jgi:hypothetical protein